MVEEPAEGLVGEPELNNPFIQDDLLNAWDKYLKSIEKSNPRLYSILYNHPPKDKEGNVVEINLLITQKAEVEKERGHLIGFLRNELKNSSVTLYIEVIQKEEGPQKAFTASDKFKKMVEKNPVLGDMKKKFGLDID